MHRVARQFRNSSQMTSNVVRTEKWLTKRSRVSLMFLPHLDIICELLLNYNMESTCFIHFISKKDCWRGSFKGDFGKCNPPISKEIDSWNFLVHNVDLGEKENIFEHNQLLGIEICFTSFKSKCAEDYKYQRFITFTRKLTVKLTRMLKLMFLRKIFSDL